MLRCIFFYQVRAVLLPVPLPAVWLPRVPEGELGLCKRVLPDPPPLLGKVRKADPVQLAGGQEARQGGLGFLGGCFVF